MTARNSLKVFPWLTSSSVYVKHGVDLIRINCLKRVSITIVKTVRVEGS